MNQEIGGCNKKERIVLCSDVNAIALMREIESGEFEAGLVSSGEFGIRLPIRERFVPVNGDDEKRKKAIVPAKL